MNGNSAELFESKCLVNSLSVGVTRGMDVWWPHTKLMSVHMSRSHSLNAVAVLASMWDVPDLLWLVINDCRPRGHRKLCSKALNLALLCSL